MVGPHKSEGEAQLSSFLQNASVFMNNSFREHSLPLGPRLGMAARRVRGHRGGIEEGKEALILFSVSPRCCRFGSGEERHLLSLLHMSLRASSPTLEA